MRLVSIISVCLNAENEIRDTILSVLKQDCNNFEYLIKDGKSNDQTVKIAESFAPAFAEKGIPFQIISKRDKGIYDAMNVATQKAQGKWILYLNAGDCLANGHVLSQINRNDNFETADVIYGDQILRDRDLYMFKKAKTLENIRFGMPFGHQSVFTKKSLLEESPFSLQYKICSDYLFYLQLYYEKKKFVYIPIVVSIYDVNGISSDIFTSYQERLKIYEEMPIRDEKAIRMVKSWSRKNARKTFVYEHFLKFIPSKLRQIRSDCLKKKTGWLTEEEFFDNKNKK